jgi:hypothetical protein
MRTFRGSSLLPLQALAGAAAASPADPTRDATEGGSVPPLQTTIGIYGSAARATGTRTTRSQPSEVF